MTDDKYTNGEPENIPALFATIHHRSDERPNGYTPEDIAELNRLANERPAGPQKMWNPLWIAGAVAGVLGIGAACTPWILMAWDDAQDARRDRAAAAAVPTNPEASSSSDATNPAPTADVQAPAYMDVKGIYIGQYREDVATAVTTRGWMVGPDNSPLMEMHFAIPRHEAAEALYIDEPACREGLERRANQTSDEANSVAGPRLEGCQLAGRVFYDSTGAVTAFYVTPEGFGIDQITIEDFAQAIVDNHEVKHLEPQQVRLRTLGFDGYCTDYLGTGWPNVRVKVSDCGFMRVQVETSATSNADFS